jgi:phage-related protein
MLLKVYHIKVEWTIDFYVEPDGSAPVEEFLDSLSTQARAKALAVIQTLKLHGPNLPFPYSSQAAGKIRELRTQHGKDKIRVLYFADARRVFVLLHGFVKRTAKLEQRELRQAELRMAHHNHRISKKGRHRE